jgi:hypothetical protein
MWDLWWTNRYWYRVFSEYLGSPLSVSFREFFMPIPSSVIEGKGKAVPYRPGRPLGLQEVEAPRFLDNRHMKVVRLSPAAFTPQKRFPVLISVRG